MNFLEVRRYDVFAHLQAAPNNNLAKLDAKSLLNSVRLDYILFREFYRQTVSFVFFEKIYSVYVVAVFIPAYTITARVKFCLLILIFIG